MAGYKNRVLRVDLSRGEFTESPIDGRLIEDYLGGRGFGVKLLYDDLKPGTDPLGEENELVFVTGPLAGTSAAIPMSGFMLSISPAVAYTSM